MIRGTKRRITDGILHSEMLRLARLVPAGAGLAGEPAADALSEIIAAFPVYRSYLPEGAEVLKEACELAVRRRPELDPPSGCCCRSCSTRRPASWRAASSRPPAWSWPRAWRTPRSSATPGWAP